MISDFLEFEFLQHALIAAILVSIAVGIIGSLIVVNRMVFLAGGIAHSAYGGIGLSLFFGFEILLSTSVFTIFIAFLMTYLILYEKKNIDSYIGVIWASGMAFGIILSDLTPGYNVDMMSYLFGSILSVPKEDLIYMMVLDIIIILSVTILYPIFLGISYDIEFAKLRKIHIAIYYLMIMILAALSIVIAIRAVGLILVIALMTIPTYISEKLSSSLKMMMVLSVIFAVIFSILGLILSYIYDVSSGASIIAVSVTSFILFHILQRFRYNTKN